MTFAKPNSSAGRALAADGWHLGLITLVVALVWCAAYHRWSGTEWRIPLRYVHDDLLVFGLTKAHAEGAIGVFGTKIVPRLNAPFSANWNDFPITEDLMFGAIGSAARMLGVFAAANLAFLLASLLAGWAFYIAARWLSYVRIFCAVGAVAFALPSLLFQRGIGHLMLASFWYIPILLAALEKVRDERRSLPTAQWAAGGAVFAVLVGLGSMEYYSWMSAQLAALAMIGLLINRQFRRALIVLAWLGALGFATVLGNCDTLLYAIRHGVNSTGFSRSPVSLTLDALQLPTLFLPPLNYRIAALADWSNTHFYRSAVLFGEGSTPYLGLVGATGLIILTWFGLRAFLARGRSQMPAAWSQLLWILIYSLPGGINVVLGVFGLLVFRDTNRYSIFILAISLVFLTRYLSRRCPRGARAPVGVLLAAIAVLDQVPAALSGRSVAELGARVDSDRRLVSALEARLPRGGMVFELPVVPFPESPPVNLMGDYEHLIPYLHSQRLRFSYGTVKGRGSENWQHVVERLPAGELAGQLEREGFDAIWVNRRGYADRAEGLIGSLRAGREIIESEQGDLVAIVLHPSGHEPPMPFGCTLGPGMYGWEADAGGSPYWTWSLERSEFVLYNGGPSAAAVHLDFELRSLRPQRVAMAAPNFHAVYDLSQGPAKVSAVIMLAPGATKVEFTAANPPMPPGNGDMRPMAFGIYNPKIDGRRP